MFSVIASTLLRPRLRVVPGGEVVEHERISAALVVRGLDDAVRGLTLAGPVARELGLSGANRLAEFVGEISALRAAIGRTDDAV